MTKEEAIKEIKSWDFLEGKEIEAIQTLVPELRESKDEKIRKALIQEFKEKVQKSFEWKDGIPNNAVLDWLEKQKERGPLTKEEEYTLHRIIEYLEDETCPSEWISLLYDIYCLPYEKQKEEEGYDAIPVESTLEYKLGFKAGKDSEKQKEQKPAEWSEEDDKMLQRIIRHTESEYQDWCNDKYGNSEIVSDGKRSCLERLDWLEKRLKSLRPQPHWKPSEEQMRFLLAVINEPNNAGSESCHLVLKGLYEQLKNL